MGCCPSSSNRVDVEYNFNSDDLHYLRQSWNIIKNYDYQKFALDVLLKMVNQNPQIRQYYRSKVQVDGNNYDYGQHDSCLRTDRSWQVGLKDQSLEFISIFDQLLIVIYDEQRFKTKLRSIQMTENIFSLGNDSLLVIQESVRENVCQLLKTLNYDSIDKYEYVWNKFLTFIVDYMIKQNNLIKKTNEYMVTPANNNK